MATTDPLDAFGMRRNFDWDTTFRENDGVRILEGEMSGEVGTVISMISRQPQPVYIVETCCGRDVMVQESEIELLQSRDDVRDDMPDDPREDIDPFGYSARV